MLRVLLVATALLGGGAIPLNAQEARWPGPGDRVRVASPQLSGEFLVVESDEDALLLRSPADGSDASLRVAAIDELEISMGERSTGSKVLGVILGAGVGLVLGTALGGATGSGLGSLDTAESGAYIGAGLGGAVGLVIASRERWAAVPLPSAMGLRLEPGGDLFVGFRLGF